MLTPNDRFQKLFIAILFTLKLFGQKITEMKPLKKNLSIFPQVKISGPGFGPRSDV